MHGALTSALVEPLLRGRLGHPYLHRDRCASTQDLVRGLPEGAVACCELQTAGRGRRDRGWSSPHGKGLLFSLSLRPRTAPGRLAPFSLVLAEAVCMVTHPRALVRWPNDVVIGGKKLAGVLPELREDQLVAGIGINVNLAASDLPANVRVPATSLLIELGHPVERAALLADLLEEIERRYDRFESAGFEGLERDDLRGRDVVLVGGERGRCEGSDLRGRLVVNGVAHSSAEVERVEL